MLSMGELQSTQGRTQAMPHADPRKGELFDVNGERYKSFPCYLTALKETALGLFRNGGRPTFKEN